MTIGEPKMPTPEDLAKQQTNKESKEPAYYDYKNSEFLEEVKEFERTLPDNPKTLIGWREGLEKANDTLVRIMVNDKSVTEEYHQTLDKMHAINRRLNALGYEEK